MGLEHDDDAYDGDAVVVEQWQQQRKMREEQYETDVTYWSDVHGCGARPWQARRKRCPSVGKRRRYEREERHGREENRVRRGRHVGRMRRREVVGVVGGIEERPRG